MGYKERMKVRVSEGEDLLFIAFSHAGLTKGMTRQKHIHLLDPCPEYPNGLDTFPDYMIDNPDYIVDLKMWVGYLDNIHLHKGKRLDRDEVINDLLKGMGWKVTRWPYSGKLSNRRKCEIVEEVRKIRG